MTITVDAVYRNGRLEFKEPVVLADGTPVRVAITPVDKEGTPAEPTVQSPGTEDPFEAVIGTCDGPADGAANHDNYLYGESRP